MIVLKGRCQTQRFRYVCTFQIETLPTHPSRKAFHYNDAERWSGAWNFGPSANDTKPVSWIADFLTAAIPNSRWEVETAEQPHEANLLKLDSSKARSMLNWRSRWSIQNALAKTVEWHQAWRSGMPARDISLRQIEEYLSQ